MKLRYPMLIICQLLWPSAGNASLDRAVNTLIEGQYAETEMHLQALLKNTSDKDQIQFLLGRLDVWLNKQNDAFVHFEKATKHNLQNPEYHWWLSQMYGYKAITASIFRKPGHARNLKKELEKTIELAPDHMNARISLINYHLKAPGILGGNKDEVQNQVKQIKAYDPIRGHAVQADLYKNENDLYKAEQEHRMAVEKAPDNPDAMLRFTRFLNEQKRYDEAIQLYESYFKNHPTTSYLLFNFNRQLRTAKRLDLAYQTAEQCLAQIADTLSIKTPNATPKVFIRTLTLHGRRLNTLYDAGRLAAESGNNLDQSLKYLETYLRLTPQEWKHNQGRAYNQIGQIYLHQNKVEKARKAFQTALKLDPKRESARQALKSLK